MRRVIWLILMLLSPNLFADPVFTGIFEGTGRSCYGILAIRTKTLSWLTPFSQCQKVRYEVLEQSRNGNAFHATYLLKNPPRACAYKVLVLTHDDSPNPDIYWDVTGYGSEKEYEQSKREKPPVRLPGMMSCYLVTR